MEERCGIIGLEGDMGSALDNCCVCFNYDWPARTIAPTQVDSNQPTSFLPTPTPTFFTAMPTYSVYDYGLCYTEMECEDIFNKYDIFTEFVSGDYPFHGGVSLARLSLKSCIGVWVAQTKRLFRIIMKSSSTMEKINGCLN
jgi:hypothetical protein